MKAVNLTIVFKCFQLVQETTNQSLIWTCVWTMLKGVPGTTSTTASRDGHFGKPARGEQRNSPADWGNVRYSGLELVDTWEYQKTLRKHSENYIKLPCLLGWLLKKEERILVFHQLKRIVTYEPARHWNLFILNSGPFIHLNDPFKVAVESTMTLWYDITVNGSKWYDMIWY